MILYHRDGITPEKVARKVKKDGRTDSRPSSRFNYLFMRASVSGITTR